MSILPMFPKYRAGNGVQYDTLQEAAMALGTVTLNRNYDPPPKPFAETMPVYLDHAEQMERGTYTRPTIFEEIVAVPERLPDDLRELYPLEPGRRELPIPELAEIAVQGLRDYIKRSWDPDAQYIMPHSSGYDSRLISALLCESHPTRESIVPGGTGNVYFITWQPEVESTRKLLAWMGWPEDRLLVAGDPEKTEDYQAPALDFLALGAYQSDSERFIVGPSLAEMRLKAEKKNWTTITATFSDETSAFNTVRWPRVSYFHAARLLDGPPPWPSKRWLMPFVSREHVRFLTSYQIPCSSDEFKRAMLATIDPDLANYPNQRYELAEEIKQNGHHKYANLSQATCDRLLADYNSSWYMKMYGKTIAPPPWGTDHPGVREYIKAAICEFLVNEGVTIK